MGLALIVAACGGAKQGDCTALMGVINDGLVELENGRQQQKNDPTHTVELRAMSESLEKTSAKVGQLSITTPEVKALGDRYQAMVKEVAKSTREVIDAHEKSDVARMAKAQSQLNEALKLEDPIVDDLNKLCSQ